MSTGKGQAERVLALAREELGNREFPPGSNNVKYNAAYYGREVSGPGLAWCAVFLWWLFRQAGLAHLYYGGGKTAYVPALMDWAVRQGLVVSTPRPGDLVCFQFDNDGGPDHVGLCEEWDGNFVTTIDGNTGAGNEANGGAVMRRRRHRKYILCVIRPKYEEAEREMTDEQFDKLMAGWLARQEAKEPDQQWQREGLARAVAAGVTDGSRPMALCTRLEAAIMAANGKREVNENG